MLRRPRTSPRSPGQRRESLSVCLVEQNQLAAEHLLQLLAKNSAITPLVLENLARQRIYESIEVIFVVDGWALPRPLSEFLRRLQVRYPKARYLVLDKDRSDEDIVRMLWLGAHGFLEHREVTSTLLDAVDAVGKGEIWVSRKVLQHYIRITASANRYRLRTPEVTTARESEIIELVRSRLSNKEIAEILSIQESTVKFHLSNIFSKLQVTSRSQLVAKDKVPGGWAEML